VLRWREMRPEIERLVELQELDNRLSDLRTRLEAYPRQIGEIDAHVAAARQRLAAAKESLTASLKDRKKYEMDVDAWKEKARKYRAQSSEVKTNDAYKALLHEIEHAEGEAAGAEDRLLERMVAGEEYERQVKAAEREVAAVDSAAEVSRTQLKSAHDAMQKERETKESDRLLKAAEVPEALLAVYENVARRRHHIGVAAVRDEACSLCGLRVVPHVFQELRRDDCTEIFQCETCTRILYYVEPAPAAAAATAPASSDGGKPSS
jgi:predicted  nucleic acid-binding Zn-ribbon protein